MAPPAALSGTPSDGLEMVAPRHPEPRSVVLDDARIQALGEGRPVVFDDVITRAEAAAVWTAFDELPLTPAGVGKERAHRPDVRSDRTCFVEHAHAPPAFEPALAWFGALQVALNTGAWLGLRAFELQAASYGAGAHYAKHVDTFRGDRARRVTAVLYLNEGWVPAHGGQLRCHLDDGCVEVAPVAGRAVVFLSDQLRHEVLPAHVPRRALTAWYRAN